MSSDIPLFIDCRELLAYKSNIPEMSPVFYFAFLVGVGFLATRDVTCITNKDFLELAIKHGAVIDLANLRGARCNCRHYTCSCCAWLNFRFFWKSVKFSGCIGLTYLPSQIGFRLTIEFNGRILYTHEMSLVNPPLPLCFPIPKIKIAKACVEFYNINAAQKSLCVKIVGKVKLWIMKFSFVHVHIGCFRVRSLTRDQFVQLTEIASSQNLTSTPTGNWPSMIDDNHEETELQELIRLLRGLDTDY
ncbi:uncharacterized protein LOC127859250 isoform X2 [Dreissena polymorpha]|uniref:uncharacterized protein LOC127859250 isoform X2 n=1 Tax=Dreissena polymorpha TaxID=45954 RepID=UPI0022649A69|nr:uncharacterized protein LOC127859250 isoform X2 [Dreissena polymorpha]